MEQEREPSSQEGDPREPVEELNPNTSKQDIADKRAENPVLEEKLSLWREGLAEMENRPDLYAANIEKLKNQIKWAESELSSHKE